MQPNDIDIIIISYNGLLVEQAVESLHRFKNNINTRIIVQQEKQSIPKNVNAGFKFVETDWWILFNDDWEALEDNWLDSLCSFIRDDIGFISCRVVFDNGLINHGGYSISENGFPRNLSENKPDHDLPDDYVKYAHPILINSKMFRELNGYDENFIGSQFADIDFVYRVAKSGYRIFFAGSVPLLHHYNKNKSTNALRERVKELNEKRFRAKHGFKKKKGYVSRGLYVRKKNVSSTKNR